MTNAVVTWKSSNPAVATVNVRGLVRAEKNGTAQVSAQSGNVAATVTVTVSQKAIQVRLEPSRVGRLSIGQTVQLTAKVLDENLQPVVGAMVTWSSSDETVATVSAEGLITAVMNGAAQITARSGSRRSSVTVTVIQSAGLEIEPTSVTLMSLGATVQLTASVLDDNDQPVPGAVVSWTSDDESVATVSAQGLVTAVMNGTALITARSGDASSTATVMVMQSAGRVVLEPSSATLMSLGATVQLTASVLDANGQAVEDAAITWSSSDEGVATVSAPGLVTAVSNGTATITARSGSVSSTAVVTVMQSAGRILLEPSSATLMSLGATVQLTASVLDQNGQAVEDAVVSWQSSDENVATVSSQGLVTAVSNGTATITARSGSVSSTAVVTVMQSAGRILLEPSSATLMSLGATVQLTASVQDENGQAVADAAISWSSNDEGVALVSSQGLVTAVSNGTATITARSGSASATAVVIVMQSAGRIVLEPSSATLMSLGETVQLAASVLDQNGQPVEGAVVSWQSSDEAVATVSGQGLVTAVSNGTATITARTGSASATAVVTVMQSAGRIVLEPSTATLMSLGATVQLTASVLDQNGQAVEDAVVSWQSSDENVATVSSQGLVTAVSNGTATITARSGSVSSTAVVTVMQSAGRILLEPSSATLMSLGATVQLVASVLDENGQPVSGAVVSWQSSDEGVATVSAQGLVTAVSNGAAQITARAGSVSSTATVTVMQSAGSILLEPSSATLMSLGATVQLVASVLDENGQPVSGAVVSWQSSDEGVATVSAQGLVTAVSNGAAQITARAGSVSSTATVTVMDDSRDREALIALYNSTDGPNWKVSTNWLSEEPLGLWHGVSTGAEGRVTELILTRNNLKGSIPPDIARLQNLTDLNLAVNLLTGSIPPDIARLQDLTSLLLYANLFTGSIPSDIARLQNLKELFLGGNRLTGTIPPELGRLENLTSLGLIRNQLTGTIPPELGRLENLTSLVLADNWLTGTISPEIANLQNLNHLGLDANPGLSGPLPDAFLNLKLGYFRINGTSLCVPSTSSFRRWLGSIPDQRTNGFCPDPERDPLVALYNDTDGPNWSVSTNWLSVEPLGEWHGVTTDKDGRVTKLSLAENNLVGLIPGQLGDLASLKVLDLSNNEGLSGPLSRSFIGLTPDRLTLVGTRVCAPSDPEFARWLGRILHADVTSCTEDRPDYYALAALYSSTNGPVWTNSDNWLSAEPLGTWFGVSTDSDGRVTRLRLGDNNLKGMIPPDIAGLQNLTELWLHANALRGAIPAELAQLENLRFLSLSNNHLTGAIPAELAQLQDLTFLWLSANQLTGTIPAELGQLRNLTSLHLGYNQLTGTILPELALLQNLTFLSFGANQLTGTIPRELGRLQNLEILYLYKNQLTGLIPPDIARLQNLTELWLSFNDLTGPLPAELGQLQNLELLYLISNRLTGVMPLELGRLQSLRELTISSNLLSGNVPSTFGDLGSLKVLSLTGNTDMSGALPSTLVNLNLESLLLGDTGLCAPPDLVLQDWLQTIPEHRVENCVSVAGRSTTYLTQAVQSLKHPVPLVAGEDALLRVFVTRQADEEVLMPPVRAAFYLDGAEVHSVDIPGSGTTVPREIEEGDLSASANAMVPGSIVTPGLQMVVEIDPGGSMDPALGVGGRLPSIGRTPVDVRDVPPFDLTLVPFLWTEDPDRSILTRVEGLTAESDLFRLTRDLLPVHDFRVDVREPVWTSFDPGGENAGLLIQETQMVRTMDGATGHYMGILRNGGLAFTPGYVSTSSLHGTVLAHELGHNFSLYHAPCGTPGDPNYPYQNGTIGAWGYGLLEESLVSPDTPDLMSYCGPRWISDYHFSKALRYRVSQAQTMSLAAAFAPSARSLLLWGGVNDVGELVLEPAFAVDARPVLPQLDGPYRLTGEGRDGGTLFRLSFGMAEIAHREAGGAFAFILPARRDWSRRLARITLSGPEGIVTLGDDDELDAEDAPAAALLLDSVTGRVRGILRDWPDQDVSIPGVSAAAARRAVPEPGLEVVISRGVPEPADWER